MIDNKQGRDMEMQDEIHLDATREAVWKALNDPEVLKACIPGCETLDMVSHTEFEALVVVKVGPIRAKFAGSVTLSEINAPVSYRLTGEGKGGVAGFAKADITVSLEEEGPSLTRLKYGVTANIGGKIAQLGSRMIEATSRKMADQFFERFNGHFTDGGSSDQSAQQAYSPLPGATLDPVAAAQPKAAITAASAPAPISAAAPALQPATSAATHVPTSTGDGDVSSATVALVSSQYITVNLIDVGAEDDIVAVAKSAPASPARQTGFLARIFGGGTGEAPAKVATPAAKKGGTKARHKAALVTLNRPEQRNAVSLAMWRNLENIFTELGRDPNVRAIILTGAGGNFSAGADISEFGRVRATVEQGTEYEVAVDRCCDAIAASPKPTIAVIDGYCMGGACNIAMSCDFRFARSDAKFGIPAARLSIVYGVRGTQRLLALVGVSNAKRIFYTAQTYGAEEGQAMGFFDRVAADPLRSAKAFAGVMADNAPLTISGSKVLLNGLAMGPGGLAERDANQVIERAVASEDYRNATEAFKQKRRPVFAGR